MYPLYLLAVLVHTCIAQPPQTPIQKQILARALAQAKPASAQAESVVLDLFNSTTTRKYLQQLDDGTGLYNLPASVLVEKFWSALSVAEIVHSFGDTDIRGANCGYDLPLPIGMQAPVFWNQWQIQALKYVPVDPENNQFTERSETTLFGFPPFKNVSAPDLPTSTDRIMYGAVNMYRGSGGNPQCGPVSAILSRKYIIDENILAAPMDTGFFSGCCNGFPNSSMSQLGNETVGVCSSWTGERPLGNPPYLSHLVLPYLTFWNQSTPLVGSDYIYLALARLLTRLLSRRTYIDKPLPLNFVENALGYFEYNLPLAIEFPQGVKMMVGMFELLWGTEQGDLLRRWCVEQGWPLVWASNPLMSYWRCGYDKDPQCTFPPSISQGIEDVNVRVLDPWVITQVPAGHNVSVSGEVSEHFQQLWNATNVSAVSRKIVQAAWNTMSGTFPQLAVEPVFPGACEDECAGVFVQAQACVCSPPQ